ncbi:MAG: ferredoxin family protein [Chlorobiaceae bacterium]|nr:ferredoxin family protein [Chlorobiaceae bacterium]
MQVLDCFFGRCEKPSCDGCLLRPVRALRIARKSRAMERCEDRAVDTAGSWTKPEPAATPVANAAPKPGTVKKRKRLLAPREEIAWFPTIKPELCNGCGDCKVLCKPGVFELGEPDPTGIHRPKLVVANPYQCLVLCTHCVPICTSGAIIMPDPREFEKFVEYVDG